MATEYYTDGQGRLQSRDTKSGEDVASAQSTSAASTTAGAGLGAMEKNHAAPAAGKRPMPKQSDYPGDLGGYGEAMRKYRLEQDSTPENQGQKRALAGMAKQ